MSELGEHEQQYTQINPWRLRFTPEQRQELSQRIRNNPIADPIYAYGTVDPLYKAPRGEEQTTKPPKPHPGETLRKLAALTADQLDELRDRIRTMNQQQ